MGRNDTQPSIQPSRIHVESDAESAAAILELGADVTVVVVANREELEKGNFSGGEVIGIDSRVIDEVAESDAGEATIEIPTDPTKSALTIRVASTDGPNTRGNDQMLFALVPVRAIDAFSAMLSAAILPLLKVAIQSFRIGQRKMAEALCLDANLEVTTDDASTASMPPFCGPVVSVGANGSKKAYIFIADVPTSFLGQNRTGDNVLIQNPVTMMPDGGILFHDLDARGHSVVKQIPHTAVRDLFAGAFERPFSSDRPTVKPVFGTQLATVVAKIDGCMEGGHFSILQRDARGRLYYRISFLTDEGSWATGRLYLDEIGSGAAQNLTGDEIEDEGLGTYVNTVPVQGSDGADRVRLHASTRMIRGGGVALTLTLSAQRASDN